MDQRLKCSSFFIDREQPVCKKSVSSTCRAVAEKHALWCLSEKLIHSVVQYNSFFNHDRSMVNSHKTPLRQLKPNHVTTFKSFKDMLSSQPTNYELAPSTIKSHEDVAAVSDITTIVRLIEEERARESDTLFLVDFQIQP